jgi:outer membrane receptor protein involved in Fe transport
MEQVVTAPLVGAFEIRKALRRLIAGTGLEIASDRDGVILLRRIPPPAPVERLIDGAPALIEEVLVTALRRESAASSTPIAIVAVSGARMEERGAASLSQLRSLVPALNMTEVNSGQRRLSLRGSQSAGENAVGLYIGEMPVSGPNSATSDPSSITPDVDLFDLERLEVLKGPQGTLFGSGAMSGAVRLLYNQPDLTRRAARLDLSQTEIDGGGSGSSIHLMLNQPVIENHLGLRLVAYDAGRPGYVDNVRMGIDDVNSVRTRGARLGVRLAPREGTAVSLTAMVQDQQVRDSGILNPALGASDAYARLPFPNRFTFLSLSLEQTFKWARMTATSSAFDWDSTKYIETTLTALVSRSRGAYCPRYNGVSGPCDAQQLGAYQAYIDSILPLVGYQPMNVHSDVHEFRLDSPAGGTLSWTLGAFVEKRSDRSVSSTVEADPRTGLAEQPLHLVFQRANGVRMSQKAIFGELSWEPVEHLTLRLGARRYSYDKTSRSQVLITSYVNASVAGPETVQDNRADGWVTRGTAAYRFNDHAMGYLQYAEGFRPGGVNNTPGLDPELVAYTADGVRNYEVGLKTTAADGRLLMDFSVFQVRWSDMQVAAHVPNFNFIANAGQATIRGFEAEGQLTVSEGLVARWSLNLIDGRLTSIPSTSRFDLTGGVGDRIPYEPRVRFSGSLARTIELPRGLSLTAVSELTHVGAAGSTFDRDDPYYEGMGRYWLVNVGAHLRRSTWMVALQVENLLDGAGVAWAGSRAEYERNVIRVQPRTVRLAIQRSW